MNTLPYSYLDACAARLNRLLPRFPDVARFEITEDEEAGHVYVHAIPRNRFQTSQLRNKLAADTYTKIGSAFPEGDFGDEPQTVAKKHPGMPLSLEFDTKSGLIATITQLERTPKHFRASSAEIER